MQDQSLAIMQGVDNLIITHKITILILRCNKSFQPELIMKLYFNLLFKTSAAIVLCSIVFWGCNEKPARKKLPDFTEIIGWEEMPLAKKTIEPFSICDTSLMQNGRPTDFFSIAMPDPSQDSAAINIVKSYEPFSGIFIHQWMKQKRKGILIDLRTQAGDCDRADFILKENADTVNVSVPVIIIWDHPSDFRVDYLMKTIASFPEIKCNLISNSRRKEGIARNDCFSPAAPSFDEQ